LLLAVRGQEQIPYLPYILFSIGFIVPLVFLATGLGVPGVGTGYVTCYLYGEYVAFALVPYFVYLGTGFACITITSIVILWTKGFRALLSQIRLLVFGFLFGVLLFFDTINTIPFPATTDSGGDLTAFTKCSLNAWYNTLFPQHIISPTYPCDAKHSYGIPETTFIGALAIPFFGISFSAFFSRDCIVKAVNHWRNQSSIMKRIRKIMVYSILK